MSIFYLHLCDCSLKRMIIKPSDAFWVISICGSQNDAMWDSVKSGHERCIVSSSCARIFGLPCCWYPPLHWSGWWPKWPQVRQTDRVGTPAHGFSVQWIKVMLTVSGRPGTHEKWHFKRQEDCIGVIANNHLVVFFILSN